MTGFLILVILGLLGITLWQLNKILLLSKSRPSTAEDQIANDKDNNVNGYLMLAFVAFLYITLIGAFIQYRHFFLPESASEHGKDVDFLLFITTLIIVVVQFLTQGLLHWFAFKYRGKKGQKALFYADNDKLELIWTAVPVVTLFSLIMYGLYTWTNIMNVDEHDEAIVIEIYAKQFGWNARYAGEDNTLGDANVRFIEGVNMLGLDPTDVDGHDDIITTELHLPVNKEVIFKIRSQDVLHSAYFPHFRAQMNAVPGMVTQFAFTPTITSDEMRSSEFMRNKVRNINTIRAEKSKELEAQGEVGLDPYEFEYYLLCNKICGVSHYNMQMKIVVEEEEEYKAWLAEQKTFGETAGLTVK
ncbi:MAG: cytochrome c oxidase subunit II [Flavobacteriaceae bacterium]|nr:cytochrome c oxidase subunit II [Flavobacteriaceae bacterium]